MSSSSGGGSDSGGNGRRGSGGGFGGAIGAVITAEAQHIFESIGEIKKPVHTVIDGKIHLWSKPVYKWATKVASGIAYASWLYAGFQIGCDPNLTLGQKWAKSGIVGFCTAIDLTSGAIAGYGASLISTPLVGFGVGAVAYGFSAYYTNRLENYLCEKFGLE